MKFERLFVNKNLVFPKGIKYRFRRPMGDFVRLHWTIVILTCRFFTDPFHGRFEHGT